MWAAGPPLQVHIPTFPRLTSPPAHSTSALIPYQTKPSLSSAPARFEHYKRPASRERSQDPAGRLGSRAGSRDPVNRAPSRQRTPMEISDNKPSGLDGLGLEGHATKNGVGNGAANGAGAALDFKLPAEDQIRFRGVQQEIPHFGAPPKRTESLYMKPGEQAAPQLKVSRRRATNHRCGLIKKCLAIFSSSNVPEFLSFMKNLAL